MLEKFTGRSEGRIRMPTDDKRFLETIRQTRDILVKLLFTDLEVAFTLLQTARASSSPETQRRNIANAREACDAIKSSADRMEVTEADRQELNSRLVELVRQLDQILPEPSAL